MDVQANVFTSSSQSNASLATASDGRTAVAWESKRQERGSFGIYARLFDAAGQPLSHEFHVNAHLPKAQWHPAVQFSADDTLWFAWESHSQDGSGAAVVARPFDAQGQPLGAEVPVNLFRQGDQTDVVLASATGDRVLAAWSSHHPDASLAGANGIRARLLSTGDVQAEEVVLSAPLDASDRRASIAALGGDGYLVSWTRTLDEPSRSILMARLLDVDGQPRSEEFVLMQDGVVDHVEGVVASNASGQLAMAWMRSAAGGYEVLMQGLDSAGQAQGDAVVVATPEDGWKSGVSLALAADGSRAVAFNHESPLSTEGQGRPKSQRLLLCQRFAADGSPLDVAPLQLSSDGQLALPSGANRLAWTADQRLLAAFDGQGSEGDGSAANLALWLPTSFQAPAAMDLGTALAATATTDEHMMAANPPIWDPNWVPQPRLPLGTTAAGGDFGFEGVPGTGWTPPDPEMAVGTSDMVVMTNGEITSLSMVGAVRWTDLIEGGGGFWGSLGAGGFVFDPEACWDPHANRFLAMASERTGGRSYFLFAISKDASPDDANDWWKYRFDVTAISGGDIDSPNMAVGPDSILLTADFFGPDKYLIYMIDKASVISGGAAVTTSELITGTSQQSMGVPVVYDVDSTHYILQSTENGSNNTVIVHAITNPFTSYNRVTSTLSVPTYTYPNQPPQKGSASRPFLFEPRFWSVAQRNGSLWAVHHVNSSRARVRWYEIALNSWPTSGAPSLVQDGEIDLGGGIHTYFPSIHVDANDNVAVTFARSNSNEYISMGRATRSASDPAGTMRSAQVVQTSTNAHTSGRWGDYSATQASPNTPGEFWGHHEFNTGGTGSWRTWVARYEMRPAGLELGVPALVSNAMNTFSISGATPGSTVRFAYGLTDTGLFEVPGSSAILSLDSPNKIGAATADAFGNAAITVFIPGGFSGTTVWLQALEDGHTSNWEQRTIL